MSSFYQLYTLRKMSAVVVGRVGKKRAACRESSHSLYHLGHFVIGIHGFPLLSWSLSLTFTVFPTPTYYSSNKVLAQESTHAY